FDLQGDRDRARRTHLGRERRTGPRQHLLVHASTRGGSADDLGARAKSKAMLAGLRWRAASGSSERAAPRRRSIAIPPGPSEEDPGAVPSQALGRRSHMFFEETHNPWPRIGPVLRFGKAVALVFVAQVLDFTSARTKCRDD